ncbi:hypothetical protein AALM99_02660 [Lactococcus muris]|uniref:Uncharacterized protein n=1 Tax=Lactococcus muris TaxID=2941330 RepID=A0ABV4D6F9_9LACT
MEIKQKSIILGLGFACGIIVTFLIAFVLPMGGNKDNPRGAVTQQIIEDSKKEISSLKEELENAEKTLKQSQDGKNQQQLTDLQTTAHSLFKIYYDYDQSQITNEERQKVVATLVSSEVAQTLFPLSADKSSSDYGSIQSQLNSLQVYAQPQTGTSITAFVDCDYTASAGDLKSNVPHYIFQVTYDTKVKKITGVTELGKVGK